MRSFRWQVLYLPTILLAIRVGRLGIHSANAKRSISGIPFYGTPLSFCPSPGGQEMPKKSLSAIQMIVAVALLPCDPFFLL